MKRRDLFGLAFHEARLAKAPERVRWDHELRTRLARLPLAIARADALAEIARGRLFRGTRGLLTRADRARLAALEPEARALFERFRAVETNALTLSIAAIAPHPAAPEFIRIGTDAALGGWFVTAGTPLLYVAADDADAAPARADALPSLWHGILYVRERGAP